MIIDIKSVENFYYLLPKKLEQTRKVLKRPLTLAEKVLYSHLSATEPVRDFKRGSDYVCFSPDRVAMQDATAQMALLQFMNAGQSRVTVPSSVHCDHLIQAYESAKTDLASALSGNKEVYEFLQTVSAKYGIDFWKPGAGIIHQVVFENYAFPGAMMIGTDSHTPNAGGLGMIAIGVGGADAVDVMAGMPWELKMPRIIGVKLTGKMNGWTSPKDVILKLAGILTVKGGTNAIIEYFGEGTRSISATGKGTICNMGAEVGATTSIFPFNNESADYLTATGRQDIANWAAQRIDCLTADAEVLEFPEKYYDQLIEIDLATLEPYINGPFTPDAATPISAFADYIKSNNYPQKMEVGLIGSCTNSSYEDLTRAASIIDQAYLKDIHPKAELIINPGSELVRYTADKDDVMQVFEKAGAKIMTNACGPCIGQWKRVTEDATRPNSIITSFNRNFAKRNDGNPNTHTFISSPEIVAAFTLAGDLCFNPLTDKIINKNGVAVLLDPPTGLALPPKGYAVEDAGYIAPSNQPDKINVIISPESSRLQKLLPFDPWDNKDELQVQLLIKVKGKCTTDHISMAGPWLRFRGHLDHISDNMLIGAVNAFNDKTNCILNPDTKEYSPVPTVARYYKSKQLYSIVVAEDNYGEGSSREHAAMEPRHLNVRIILAKSFARIHETNLKKQGMLALTFADKMDYDKIREDDRFMLKGLQNFSPGRTLQLTIEHSDGTIESIEVNHTYNQTQIEWFRAGSALNYLNN